MQDPGHRLPGNRFCFCCSPFRPAWCCTCPPLVGVALPVVGCLCPSAADDIQLLQILQGCRYPSLAGRWSEGFGVGPSCKRPTREQGLWWVLHQSQEETRQTNNRLKASLAAGRLSSNVLEEDPFVGSKFALQLCSAHRAPAGDGGRRRCHVLQRVSRVARYLIHKGLRA